MTKITRKIPMALNLLLLSVVPLIITSAITSFLFIRTTQQTLFETVEQLSKTSTEKLDVEIVNLLLPFSNKVQELNALANYNHDPRFLGTVVRALGRNEHENFSIYYATEISRFEEGGVFVESSGWVPDPDWDPTSRPWYLLAKENATISEDIISFTEPYVDSRTGQVCVTISYPVRDGEDNLVGVTGADLLLGNVSELIRGYKVSENGTMSLIDSNGLYIIHADDNKVMKANAFDELQVAKSEIAFDGGKISRKSTQTFIRDNRYYSLSPVAETPWFVLAEGPVADFYSSASIEEIVQSMESVHKRIHDISQVVTQLEQATGEQEELSEQVLQSLKDIQNSTRNITTNVGEISSSTNQTSQLCHKLRDLNSDVNKGLLACKSASTEMQEASGLINNVAKSTHNSVADLLEAVSSFQVERRKNREDRRSKNANIPEGGERRTTSDRRKNHISLEPPTLS